MTELDNLRAHPRVRVQVGPDVFDAEAHAATAEIPVMLTPVGTAG
jgi:hypothetical protein